MIALLGATLTTGKNSNRVPAFRPSRCSAGTAADACSGGPPPIDRHEEREQCARLRWMATRRMRQDRPFLKEASNAPARNIRPTQSNVANRRIADVADRGRGRLRWVESGRSLVALVGPVSARGLNRSRGRGGERAERARG